MAFDYAAWIQQAKDRLALLHEQRDAITKEIEALERGLKELAPLAESGWLGPNTRFTEGIRKVLKMVPGRRPLTPVQIQDELRRVGISLHQTYPLAAIHQVLARLVDSGEVRSDGQGKTKIYRWVGGSDQSEER